MSPERINGEAYSTPADVWSLGLSLMTVALGKLPLATSGGYWSLLSAVRDDPPPTFPLNDDRWPPALRDFCARCLVKDPQKRATCDELLDHSFVRDGGEGEEEGKLDDDEVEAKAEVEEGCDADEAAEASELRRRAESELEALLGALLAHVAAAFFEQGPSGPAKPRRALALLSRAAAATPRDALVALLRAGADGSGADGSGADGSGADSLATLALQLNLPLALVRARVDAALAAADEHNAFAASTNELNRGDAYGASTNTLNSGDAY
jgi:hypothetical protein